MPRSSASSRSRGGGKGRPYAACSRSHHPAPTPTNARPPVSASRVAAALAVMPADRNVTGVTSVPSSSPVPRPASAPSVTHGSGIGDHARSTCGIWMRWSISASPEKPARSAALATSVSQASGSSPQGNRLSWRTTFSPWEVRRSLRRGSCDSPGPRPGCIALAGRSRCARRPSPRRRAGPRARRCRLSCPARTGAGTGPSRAALRRRQAASGVSSTTATAGSPASPRLRQPAEPSSGVGAERVDDGGQAAPQPGGRRSSPAGRTRRRRRPGRAGRCRPRRAARPRRRPRGAVAPRRPGRLAGARRPDQDDQGGVGQRHDSGWLRCWGG